MPIIDSMAQIRQRHASNIQQHNVTYIPSILCYLQLDWLNHRQFAVKDAGLEQLCRFRVRCSQWSKVSSESSHTRWLCVWLWVCTRLYPRRNTDGRRCTVYWGSLQPHIHWLCHGIWCHTTQMQIQHCNRYAGTWVCWPVKAVLVLHQRNFEFIG